jgi:hypothetical protein
LAEYLQLLNEAPTVVVYIILAEASGARQQMIILRLESGYICKSKANNFNPSGFYNPFPNTVRMGLPYVKEIGAQFLRPIN